MPPFPSYLSIPTPSLLPSHHVNNSYSLRIKQYTLIDLICIILTISTVITVRHLEERLTIVDGELRNGRAGAKNFPVAPDVVAVDLGENPPVLQPPIKCLVTRPDAPLHLEVLGGVGVVLGALHLVRVPAVAVVGLDSLAGLEEVRENGGED